MTSIKSIDIEQIVSSVAEQVRKDFFTSDSADLNDDMSELVQEAFGQVKEAYVPQRKTYPLTTDHLSEETKKDHEALYRKEVEVLTRLTVRLRRMRSPISTRCTFTSFTLLTALIQIQNFFSMR
jgi:hypothetical protein